MDDHSRKIASLLARRWPWLLLGAAMLFFTIHYIPAFNLSMMDTETVWLPLFYQDIVTWHHSPSYWQWSGFNAFFPDLTIFFLLDFIGGAWFAVQGTVIFFFLAWLAACVGLVAALRRPHPLALISILFLLMVGEVCNFSMIRDFGAEIQDPLFQPAYHVSVSLLCLACAALLIHQLRGGGRIGFSLLLLFNFLGVFSNILSLVVFVIPALVTLTFLAAISPVDWKRCAWLALGIGLTGGAAFLLVPFFPVPTDSDHYLLLDLPTALRALVSLRNAVHHDHHYFFLLVLLDILTVLAGIIALFFLCFSSSAKKKYALTLGLIVFGTAVISCNWGAVILIGHYDGMEENRYLVAALILPLFALAIGLHAIIPWRRWLENLLVVLISGFITYCALFPPGPSGEYCEVEGNLPFLKDVMEKNHIAYGLVSYWRSNLYTFLSNETVTLRSVTDDGAANNLYGSLYWYGKSRPLHEATHFRLVLDPEPHMADNYGPPDQVLRLPDNELVWLYSDARSIRYNDYFGLFSNRFTDDMHTMPIWTSEMSSETGKRQGDSFIAVAGRDGDGYLTRSPRFSFKAADYRVVYRYAYLAPPAPGQSATYELWDHSVDKDEIIENSALPYLDALPHDLTRDFSIHRPEDSYEMLIRYHGSGTLRIDSLKITALVP